MNRALSALGSVSASQSVRSGRFYCIHVLNPTIYILWKIAEALLVKKLSIIGQNSSIITTMFEHKSIA